MKIHHRNYSYRPPYREKERLKGNLKLFIRFIRNYMAPFRKLLLICIFMAAIDYCGSFYLLAFYSKVVIDSILVVSPPPAEALVKVRPVEKSLSVVEREKERIPRQPTAERFAPKPERSGRCPARPPGARQKLWGIFMLYILTMLGSNMLSRMAGYMKISIGQRMTVKLREDIHAQIMRLSVAYHSMHTPGRLLARIISDTSAVQDQILTIFISGSSQVAIILVGAIILMLIQWQMLVIVAISLPFYVLIYKTTNLLLLRIHRELSHTNSCLWGLVSQKIDAIRMIQACNRENKEQLVFHRLASCYLRDSLTQNRVGAGTNCSASIVSGLASGIAVFLYGIYQVINHAISLGEMMYAYGTACALFGPILTLSNMNTTMMNLLVYLRRLANVLDEPITIADAPDAVDFPARLKRGIRMDHVTFNYDADSEPTLKDISMAVPAGSWVCIMGASGCGKTTLLNLMDRLADPASGVILFDDIPIRKIRLASLRRRVALVPQEAQIISGTVRDNICYGRPAAEPAQIISAARASELHDFVMTLPAKYETMLGEKGTTLSGGQKQRLSLARALLTDPEVLLLDDCTSSLDAETERKIQDTLSKIMAGKTAVIVSQRISMARRCRSIFVIENGLIVEIGTHDELIARGGFYSRLNAQQTD